MANDDCYEKYLLEFLLTGSRTALGNYQLRRMSDEANLKKRLSHLLEQIIEARATVRLSEFLRRHGEEIVARLTSSPQELRPRDPQIRDSLAKTRSLPGLRVHRNERLPDRIQRRRR